MRGYNPYYDASNRPLGKSSIRFSRTEIQHLALAVLALTVGFALLGELGTPIGERVIDMLTQPYVLLASFLAVSSGFVLHELAHKFVAIKYGCMAEFRAQMSGLSMAVAIALFANILFAAPGAVQIYGRVDQKENGLISLAGPATNIGIAILTLPLIFVTSGIAQYVFVTVSSVNGLLGAFNLLPFGPLDGKKVMAWNWAVWLAGIILAIGLFLLARAAPNLAI